MMDITITPTKSDLSKEVRNYLKSIFPSIEVVAGRQSREVAPKPPFIMFTDIFVKNLATNRVLNNVDGIETLSRESLVTYQVDCFGKNSFDLAQTIETVSRSTYPLGVLQISSLVDRESVMPLTFISGEEEYEQRNMIELKFQFRQQVSYPVDYVDKIDLKFIGVA